MVIEISVGVIAAAFAVLVIYIIIVINNLRSTLGHVNHTLTDARGQLDELGRETKKILEHTNQVSFDLKRKMESLDSIFAAAANIGEIIEYKTDALKKGVVPSSYKEHKYSLFSAENERKSHEVNQVADDILELAGIGIRLWQKIKKRR